MTRHSCWIVLVALMLGLALAGCSGSDLSKYTRTEMPNPEGKAHNKFGKPAKPEKERETSESYYGRDGKPVLDKEGVHKKV